MLADSPLVPSGGASTTAAAERDIAERESRRRLPATGDNVVDDVDANAPVIATAAATADDAVIAHAFADDILMTVEPAAAGDDRATSSALGDRALDVTLR